MLVPLLTFELRAQQQPVPPESATQVQALIASSMMSDLRWPDFTDYRKHLLNFYGPENFGMAWSRDGHPTPQALAVIELFRSADARGLQANDYDAPRWDARLRALAAGPASPSDLARFDVQLSATLMRYISDLHIGRINPRNIQFDLDIEHKKYYLPKLLAEIKVAGDVHTILDHVEPPYAEYVRLGEALEKYRRIMADGEQPALPAVAILKPGEKYTGLPQLVTLLRRVGDLPQESKPNVKIYEGAVVDAVKRFQKRHGLEPDGKISARTLAALNVPLSRRLQQIQWAMERWRWAPAEFTQPPVIVNIPEFRLRAWDQQQHSALEMNVVVGQAFGHETPVFQADMRYLVFRPYWNVPPSIQRAEISPKLQKDRDYLAEHGYEAVDDYSAASGTDVVTPQMVALIRTCRLLLRQKPGGSNALGLVKFMFPNRNNVYLHSTPSQLLFAKSRRDFSHGCIRVEKPAELAAWLLRDQADWTPDKIAAAMKGPVNNIDVNLKDPVPVLIVYATVVALENGEVHFFDDIYGHDQTLENALAAGYPYPA